MHTRSHVACVRGGFRGRGHSGALREPWSARRLEEAPPSRQTPQRAQGAASRITEVPHHNQITLQDLATGEVAAKAAREVSRQLRFRR